MASSLLRGDTVVCIRLKENTLILYAFNRKPLFKILLTGMQVYHWAKDYMQNTLRYEFPQLDQCLIKEPSCFRAYFIFCIMVYILHFCTGFAIKK